MAGYYNPLSEKPDVLGGLNELLQLYAQMMMMKQFYGQGQPGQQQGRQQGQMMQQPQQQRGQQATGRQQGQVDIQQLMQLIQMMQQPPVSPVTSGFGLSPYGR